MQELSPHPVLQSLYLPLSILEPYFHYTPGQLSVTRGLPHSWLQLLCISGIGVGEKINSTCQYIILSGTRSQKLPYFSVVQQIFKIRKEKNGENRCRKAIDKIQYLFVIKMLNKLSIEEHFLNLLKYIYEKHTSNITFVIKD